MADHANTGGLVRQARRPAGWEPPGPDVVGPGERADLWPQDGEDLCYLAGVWRIFQRLDGHRTSLDDLVTAWYGLEAVAGRAVTNVLDQGCGCGSVLMRLAWSLEQARVVGIEAQELSVGLARRSIAYNGVEHRVEVRHGDLRDAAMLPEVGHFDLVTATPPYIPLGDGVVSATTQKGRCRFEYRGGIEGYCESAARALAPRGRFVVCHSDPARVVVSAQAAQLTILERRDVIPREARTPLFSLFAMAHADEVATGDGGQPLVLAPPLVIRDAEGARTPECMAVRTAMGMPP